MDEGWFAVGEWVGVWAAWMDEIDVSEVGFQGVP